MNILPALNSIKCFGWFLVFDGANKALDDIFKFEIGINYEILRINDETSKLELTFTTRTSTTVITQILAR